MKFKKIISLTTICVVSSSLFVGCGNKKEETTSKGTIKIGMVADTGGINDESFNQLAWEGLQRAKEDFGVEIKVIESKQASEYLSNIESLIEEEMDLIIGVGNTMANDIKEEAKNYPEQKFAMVDETYDEIPANVVPIIFKENEAAYLTGLVAGKMTKTNHVGFIGGMDNNIIARFQYGYMAGVKDANENAKISAQYAGTFSDAAKGKSLANQMYANDVDIILSAAGSTGLGAIEAAKEKGKYAIGVDKDQSSLAPENVLTSALKKVDVGVYNVVKDLKDNTLVCGVNKLYG
jgi:basic membrane protein A